MENESLWQAKLAARLHDPIEKALILMRTPEGHEGGTSATLRHGLGIDKLPQEIQDAVTTADHWASAADRAAFPNREGERGYPRWQQVRFHERPVIIHPLTGTEFDLKSLADIQPEAAKTLALEHLRSLTHEPDLRQTALAFWRFGPEITARDIQSLWSQLPADTRVPDHSIHDHLDLTAALATTFAADAGGPALLNLSLGPVQAFIAAARSTSDLWAGSHLLSRFAWEAMRVICERLGPEAILFPRLRGIPQVDLWLRDKMGLRSELFETCEWTRSATDANPLFAAALPNRFTAVIPADQARELADAITSAVREWAREQCESAYRKLLEAAGTADDTGLHGYTQIREQLNGFPEIHWAAVPWSLVESDGSGKVPADTPRLRDAMQRFFTSDPPGYLGTQAWRLLSGGLTLEEGRFWRPNPGTLYPALHEVLERAAAAAKSARPFDQTNQKGWRDSLDGEAEWLTDREEDLKLRPLSRSDTLWSRVAEKRPAWSKKRDHLSAVNTLKRLWPTLFVEELKDVLASDGVSRFVVSSHTMAIATSLARAIDENRDIPPAMRDAIDTGYSERVALPRKLNNKLQTHPDGNLLRRVPGWLESMRETDDDDARRNAERQLEKYLGVRPEAYYGLLLMDGDHMGAWLSAERETTLPHATAFHPQIRAGLRNFSGDPKFVDYANEPRAPSPSRHMAISEALNNFALHLAPQVAERHYHGRVLYAGGDDLMAMFPVIDLLPAMAALRAAYSGIEPGEVGLDEKQSDFTRQGNGFVQFGHRLLRMMGKKATASSGAVVAHHQAPLGAVLRELRAAEQRAKTEGERNAFSLSIVKRSGGALRLTAHWGEPVRLLIKLREFLAEPSVSRRAVYNSALWLRELPPPDSEGAMVASLLSFQLQRQIGRGAKTIVDYYDLPRLATELVRQSLEHAGAEGSLAWIENFLSVAEFLARETRSAGNQTEKQKENAA